jgi:hypothetical protein
MGTRSRIGVMHGNKVKSIYCHWDGYLEGVGATLLKHYDSAKANHLVALGDMSSLQADIGEKHAFSKHDKITGIEYREHNDEWCTFYGRDRGEKDTEFKVATTFDEFLEQCDLCGAEYYYIMRDGVWYMGDTYSSTPLSKKLTALAEALEQFADAEEVDQ